MAGCKTNEKLSTNSFCRRAQKLQMQRKSMKDLGDHMTCKLNSWNFQVGYLKPTLILFLQTKYYFLDTTFREKYQKFH